MQYVKKMALVDPQLVESLLPLNDQPPSTTTSRVMSSLDSDMNNIVDRAYLSERENVASYNQLLSRYNTIEVSRAAQPVRVSVVKGVTEEGYPPPAPLPPSTAALSGIEREIVESMPKTLKGKARFLIEKMKTDPLCRLNDRGEFAYDGEPIAGSNMVDLVNDLMRKRKKTLLPPVGREAFGDRMRRLNVLMEFVGNSRHQAYIQQQQSKKWSGKRRRAKSLEREWEEY